MKHEFGSKILPIAHLEFVSRTNLKNRNPIGGKIDDYVIGDARQNHTHEEEKVKKSRRWEVRCTIVVCVS